MKCIRGAGISLLVLFGMSAFASVASAEPPEFGRCVAVAKGTGAVKNSTCTTASAAGNYEWMPGAGTANKFTLAMNLGKIFTLEAVGGTKITCRTMAGTGECASTKAVSSVVLTFSGCETSLCQVNSVGEKNGRVVMHPLDGALGTIKKGVTSKQDKIGLVLFPQESGGSVAEMHCAGLPIDLKGSVIVPVNANKMQLTSVLKFAATKGKQKPEQFEGEPKNVLEVNTNGGPFEQAGWTMEDTLTSEEPIEVNSVV